MKIAFYDTETSGLPIRAYEYGRLYIAQPYIVQMAWFVYDTETKEYTSYEDYIKVNEMVHVSEGSINIHGITPKILNEKGKHIIDVLNTFRHSTKHCNMYVAHNVAFDKPLILKECERNDISAIFNSTAQQYCTMKSNIERCGIIKTYRGKESFKYPKLLELHEHMFPEDHKSLIVAKLHNALHDVVLTARCYLYTQMSLDLRMIHPELFQNLYQ